MNGDWIEALLRGSYETALPEFAVSAASIGQLTGSGQLSWTADTGIRVQGATGGAEILTSLLFCGFGTPGQLLPNAELLTFTGRTSDNWDVRLDPTPRDGFTTHSNLPDVVWDLPVRGLTLSHMRQFESGRVLRVLAGPCPPMWPRMTCCQTDNEFFGGQSMQRDWLVTNARIGQIAAKRRSDEWFEIRILPNELHLGCDAAQMITATCLAFGFLLGRKCVNRGYEDLHLEGETRRLNAAAGDVTKNALLSPLGIQLEYMQNVEKLLGPTVDFFLSEIGAEAARYLSLCWDTADNAHHTRLAISALSLEGLLRLAAGSFGPSQPEILQTDVTAFRALLDAESGSFTPQFISRVAGVLGTFNDLSANEIFRDWERRGTVGVVRDDLLAWRAIRHPAAHGRFTAAGSQDELQVRVNNHARVQNLMNRILLQLIGYTGPYIDYSQPGFPAAPFPPT